MACLAGLTVYVSKRVDGDLSVLTALTSKLQSLGAQVSKRITREVSHVVFLQKLLPSAAEQALQDAALKDVYSRLQKANPNAVVVSSLWVHSCLESGSRAEETPFVIAKPAEPAVVARFLSRTPDETSKGKKRSGITPKRANHKSVPLPGDAFTLDTNATLFSSSQQMQADAAGTPTLAQGTASRKRRASAPEHVLLAGSKVTRLKNNADAPSSALRATRQARSASPAPITNHAAATAADEAGPAAAPAAPAAAAGGRAGTSPRAKRAVVWADNLTPQTSPVHGLTLHTATDTKPHRQPQSAQPTPASTSGTPHTFNLTPGSVMTVNTDMSPLGLGSPIDGTWERRRSSGAASRLGMGAGAGSRQQGPSNPASPAPVQPAAAAAAAPEFALFAGGAAAAAARVCDTPFLAGKRSGAATAAAGSIALQPAQSAAQSPAAIPAVRSTAAAVPPLTLHRQSDPGYVDLSLAARLAGAGASGSGGTPADSPSVPLAARLLMKHRRKSSSASLPALKAPTLLITPRPSPLGTPVATPAGTPHAAEDAVAGPGGAAGAAQGAADDAAQMGAQGSLPGSSMQLGVSAASTPAGPNTSAAANAEASPVPTGQSPDVIPCSVITNWGCAGVSPLAPHGADDGDACESNPAAVPAVGRARGAQLPALTPQDPTQPRALRSRASQPTVHTVADSPVFIDLTNTPGYSEHAANADQPPSQSAQGSMGAGTAKQGANAHGLHAAQAGGARRLQGVQQVPMARGGQHADGSKGAKRSPDNKKRGGIWKYLVGSQAGQGGGAGPSKAGAQGPRPAAGAEGGGGSSGGGGDGAPQLQRKSAGGTAGQLCAPRLRGAATGKDAGQ